jgi:hypothetical protein
VSAVAAAHPDKRVQVWHQDEARFGQQGTLTRTWAATGSRPTAIRQTQYEYLWVLTATCAETGGAVGLVAPNLDAGVVNAFLAQFAAELPADVHAVLVWDGAGFHRAKALAIPANVTVVFLPPYAPELNPVENLWHYLRSHFWSNRLYKDYAALLDAATTAWRAVCLTADLVRSICACGYLGQPVAMRQELV